MITQVIARDEDDGVDGEISYELLETRHSSGQEETTLIVAATDGGIPSLSANATIIVTFFTPCLVQQYTVEPLTGIVSALFLCSIDIQPLEPVIILGSNFSFICTVIGNVPEGTLSLLHNSTLTMTKDVLLSRARSIELERFESTFLDSGQYQCRIDTSIGTALSQISTLSVAVIGNYEFKYNVVLVSFVAKLH